MRHLLLYFIPFIFFPSCVTIPTNSGKNTSASWKVAQFSVSFQAGPHANREENHRSFSYYSIEIKAAKDTYPFSLVFESALFSDSFTSPKDLPSDFITLFASESGHSLLIQENVPNDCAPCTNYLLVQVMEQELSYQYLDLPTRGLTETEYENARVTAISDKNVTYRYSDGSIGTRSFASSKKSENQLTFPG